MRVVAQASNPDIIALTESWTNQNISNQFLNIPNYKIIARHDRNDTNNGRGGGILIYVRDGIPACENGIKCDFNQFACIELKLTNQISLDLVIVYRSPNSSSSNNEHLFQLLREVKSASLVVGDFNFPSIDWGSSSGVGESQSLVDLSLDKFWNQLVAFPTHKNGNILDLVFAESGLVADVHNDGQLGSSDHCILLIEINRLGQHVQDCHHKLDYHRADYNQLRHLFLDCDWASIMDVDDVNQSWLNFKEKYHEVVRECVPIRRCRNRKNPPWLTKELVSYVRHKRKLWKKYKDDGSNESYGLFKAAEKSLRKKIRKSKLSFERKIAKNAKKDPKSFYAYIGNKRLNRMGVGPLQNDQGQIITDDLVQARMLNEYYATVFEQEIPMANQHSTPLLPDRPILDQVYVSHSTVKDELLKLKRYCAPGPDGVASVVLIEAAQELSRPLAFIFKQTLRCSMVPEDWKRANVTPVHKSGSLKSVSNYRPISLTSIVSKILEKIIKNAINTFLLEHNLLNRSQHGFMPKKSCLTNLLHCMEEVTSILDEGDCVDILYLDFAKAFDKVQHQRLMLKLEGMGIVGAVLGWIKAWLLGRSQRVVLNGKESDWIHVPCSVPQGSVLGPLLFLVYIDDIDACTEQLVALLLKFADDTKVVKRISSAADCADLQRIVENLTSWANKWQMHFNVGKCKILHFGRNNPRQQYFMDGTALDAVTQEKDLGVLIDSTAKPSLQCAKAALKANQVLGQLLRSFHSRDMTSLVQLYKVFVRPHLEYAVQVWCPYTANDTNALEKVQKRLVRQITGLAGSYEEKLKKIGLTTLQERRVRGDCIETFKMLQGLTNVDATVWFALNSRVEGAQTRLSTDPLSLAIPRSRLDLRKSFFSARVPSIWNSLPLPIRQSRSTNQFKNAYDEFMRNNN